MRANRSRNTMPNSARDWYEDGVADHYRAHGASYRNPHAEIIDRCLEIAVSKWSLKLERVLDLAAGAGEFTLALERATKRTLTIDACDAFTMQAYRDQTGRACKQLSFEQIAGGALRRPVDTLTSFAAKPDSYSLIGCSFAMHLCPVSELPALLLELSQVAHQLLILSPHKRPNIRDGWGWSLRDSFTEQRVHVRLLESTFEKATLSPDT